VLATTPMTKVLVEMSDKRLGLTTVLDEAGRLLGLISDGDIRRQLAKHGRALPDRTAGECMTRDPVLIGRRELAARALQQMEARKITSLLVVDERGALQGVLHLHDLWQIEMV
jgi:arabinose-5-phosphate isomerase